MGIPRGSARLLLEESRARPFSGTVLQLGRSSVYFSERELERWAGMHGVELQPAPAAGALSHDPRLAAQGCMDDRTLFRRLGFDAVEASDIVEWEGADHIFDLNGEIPPELEGRFDVVFETGTIVQIFHLPRVLDNLHRLLKPGGRVIHSAVPSNNHMDLGFYMLCPNFYSDFYSANRWQIEANYLCEYFAYWHGGRLYSDKWRVYEYSQGCLDALSYGRYGGHQAAVFLVARKSADSTGDVVPQLGQYRLTWQEFEGRADDPEAVAGLKQADAGGDLSPALLRFTLPFKRVMETVRRRLLPRKMPPLVMRL